MSKIETEISTFMEYGVCLATRTITLFDEISEVSAERFVKGLHLLDNYKEGTITVKLSSEGGCVISGFAIYDAIRASKNHVRGIVYGECSSMATVILQAFDERLLMPNSFLMIHSGSQTISGHPKSNENWLKLYKDLDDRCNKIYLEKINNRQKEKKKKQIQVQELEKMLDFDTVILPKKVVALGLADLILEDSY
jgi:ATP-dependent protease ClpP protease subunit